MTRKEFEELVIDTYDVRADYPFEEDFETGVFRHENGKWFALAECDTIQYPCFLVSATA